MSVRYVSNPFLVFVPISIDEYLLRNKDANPDMDIADLRGRLQRALSAALRGERCSCGNPIWVVGSADAGLGCFTCITSEAAPSDDFEIAEALVGRMANKA